VTTSALAHPSQTPSLRDAALLVARHIQPQIAAWEGERRAPPGVLDALREMRRGGEEVSAQLAANLGQCESLGALLAAVTALAADELAEACGLRAARDRTSTLTAAFGPAPALAWASDERSLPTLSGSVTAVVSAKQSRTLLLRISENEVAAIDLEAPGVRCVETPDVGCHAAGLARIDLDRVHLAPHARAELSAEQLASLETRRRLYFARGLCAWSQKLFDDTFDFVSSRSFGAGRLVDQQVIRHRLADLIARQKLLDAQRVRAERSAGAERSLAALFVAETLASTLPQLVKDCQQLHGGRGFLTEYWVSRAYRDSLCLTLLLGTAEERHARIAAQLSPTWQCED
jgi:alkylation response protein AidB-like acyl-CoA dehydrogenase